MSYGLRTYNDDGFIQIDEELTNLVVTESGTGSATPSGSLSFSTASYAQTYTYPPLVFVRPASFGVYVGCYMGAGDFVGDGFGYQASGDFDWKAVSMENLPSVSGNHGLQVLGATGELVYDSRRDYLAVKSVQRFYTGAGADRDVAVAADGNWILINNLIMNPFFSDSSVPPVFWTTLLDSTTLRVRCGGQDGAFNAVDSFYNAGFSPIVVMTAKFE